MPSTTGKELWNAPHAQSGYQSPEDLLVAGGLVWNAPTTRTQDTGVFTGRDPKTGEAKVEFPPDVNTYWFHHRCYIAKATDNFIIPSRTGIEFVDLKKQNWDINHWVRGGCLYGVMPCNGLVYAPPHNCACYPEAKLYGMNALAPTSPTRQIPADCRRRGATHARPRIRQNRGSSDSGIRGRLADLSARQQPQRLDDERRPRQAPAVLGNEARRQALQRRRCRWPAVCGPSGPAHAPRARCQQRRAPWNFTTGGRVDSPPTVDKGRVVFGSADGCVYCLRATDGALAWRFRAAPHDLRLAAFEQIESVWPVHGSVLD